MNIKLLNKGTGAEVLLEGRLDANSSREAEGIFREIAGKYDSLTLNLGGLTYISSAGLRIIKIVHMIMFKKSGNLTLKNVSPAVMEVFEITGFAGLLHFE